MIRFKIKEHSSYLVIISLLLLIVSGLLVLYLIFSTENVPDGPSLSCPDGSGPLEVVTGSHKAGKFEPDTVPYKIFDARTASFEIAANISHSKIVLRGSNNDHEMCWSGGYVTASLHWHDLDISWDQSKNGLDGSGTYRNTAAAQSFHDRMIWTGMHIFNVHDGIRANNSKDNWKIQHSWLEYIRDDCIENDHIYSGEVHDVLFDGCYSGISVRPSSTGVGSGTTIKMDKVLLRMEPMPEPHQSATTFTVPGYGNTPFGYGNTFKVESGNEPSFEITNSVFLYEYDANKLIFPDISDVKACSNNVIIWLDGPDSAPNYLLTDFPGCFTLITDKSQGREFWSKQVVEWHDRHPEVGAERKPLHPGEYVWPRYPPSGTSSTRIPVNLTTTET